MTAVLDARSITSGYSGQPVIRDIDLHVDVGEVVALLGANGAGKTTTLLALVGELPLHAGEVRFGRSADGRPATQARQTRAGLRARGTHGVQDPVDG